MNPDHETKSAIQQKTGIHIDKPVNNKKEIRFCEWPIFLGNDFPKGISQWHFGGPYYYKPLIYHLRQTQNKWQ